MCLAVVALAIHPGYPVVVAANRDEFHARPAARAAWGASAPFSGILAGRDLEAGGTWLGVTRDGRWALLTNVREGGRNDPSARSRGELVPAVLNGPPAPACALADLAPMQQRYNGFNLLAGRLADAHWLSNRGHGPVPVVPGVHGLSNASLDTPWPKLSRTTDAVRAWVARGAMAVDPLFALLADRAQAPDEALPDTGVTRDWERVLSSPFIVGERYGTRCSTVFTIDRDGHARFRERTFDVAGATVAETLEEFRVA